MPEKLARSMTAVSTVMKKSSDTFVKAATSSVRRWSGLSICAGPRHLHAIDMRFRAGAHVAVELDAVVGAVLVVLLREFAGHPLAPAQGQALALELVEHRQRRRDREAHRVVGRLLLEDGQVLGRQRAVEVAAHEAKDHRDAALAEHEDEQEAELQLRALGLLEVRHREPPEEVEAFLDRRVDAQSAVVHRQGSFVAIAVARFRPEAAGSTC